MKKSINLFCRPIFLLAVTILLVNDHILKAAYPGWLTGKLSDFAGIFVLAVFSCAIAGKYLKTSKSIAGLHLVIAVGFILWKIAPVEYLFVLINNIINIPLPSRVKDATDIIAILILPFSYLYVKRNPANKPLIAGHPAFMKAASIFIIMLTSIAILATAAGKKYRLEPNAAVETYKKQQRLIDIFEQTLAEKKIEVEYKNETSDTTLIYRLKFIHADTPPTHDWPDQERMFVCYITLVHSPGNHTVSVQTVEGWVTNDVPADDELNRFYREYIIEPYLDKLR